MDTFTDVDIFKEIVDASVRGVAVYVLLDDFHLKSFLTMAQNQDVKIQQLRVSEACETPRWLFAPSYWGFRAARPSAPEFSWTSCYCPVRVTCHWARALEELCFRSRGSDCSSKRLSCPKVTVERLSRFLFSASLDLLTFVQRLHSVTFCLLGSLFLPFCLLLTSLFFPNSSQPQIKLDTLSVFCEAERKFCSPLEKGGRS